MKWIHLPKAKQSAPLADSTSNLIKSGGPRWLAALVLPLLFCSGASVGLAQERDKEGKEIVEEVDPYTRGEAKAMEKAGYLSYGPFAWSHDSDTAEIMRVLGEIPMLWVETEHFRIGCSLPVCTVAEDQVERAKIKDELKQLKKILPRIKPNVRELDRWLMMHLYAWRLESLYDDFAASFGLPEDGKLSTGDYLGQAEKYRVMLFEKSSGLGRYTQNFLDLQAEYSMRWCMDKTGCMFFGAAREPLVGTHDNDTAYHASVASGVATIMLEGAYGYREPMPPWFTVGVSHTFSKRVDPRYFTVGQADWLKGGEEDEWSWEPRVFGRVKNDYFPTWEEMFGWNDIKEFKAAEHMMSWSRVRFLLEEPEVAAKFLENLKGSQLRSPVVTVTKERQTELMAGAFGMTLSEVSEAWAKHVSKTYEKR